MTKKYLKMLIFEILVRYKYLVKALILITGLIIGFFKASIRYLLIDFLFKEISKFNKNSAKF